MELRTQIFLSISAVLVMVGLGVAFANFNTQGSFFDTGVTGECEFEEVTVQGDSFDSFDSFLDRLNEEGVSDEALNSYGNIYEDRINSDGNLELKNTEIICGDSDSNE